MSEKEVWLNETMRYLLKTYGGRGKQLHDLCESGEMTPEDARNYRTIMSMLEV